MRLALVGRNNAASALYIRLDSQDVTAIASASTVLLPTHTLATNSVIASPRIDTLSRSRARDPQRLQNAPMARE